MKKFIKRFSIVLVFCMALAVLGGCGNVTEVDLTDPAKPVLTNVSYFTDEELDMDMGELMGEEYKGKTLRDSLLEDDPNLEFVDTTRDGVAYKMAVTGKYIKNAESDSALAYIDASTGEETIVTDSRFIFANKKKAELYNYSNHRSDYGNGEVSMSEAYEFCDLSVKLPFKVYYTNGKKTGKKTVVFDNSFADSNERCVAVASKAIYDEKKITVKGVKNGKTYKTGQQIKISSKNAIKIFTINDNNISANSYTFIEAGKYKIRIVLANGTEKKLTIKIK